MSEPMSRVTCFSLTAHTRAGGSHSQHKKNSGQVLGEREREKEKKMLMNELRMVEISQEEIPGSRRSMLSYIYIYIYIYTYIERERDR